MKIRIIASDRTLTAELEDSAAARDFAALLPLELTLSDYNRTEKIADLPRRLSIEGAPARRIDSEQPVHSWKLSQITEGRRGLSSASAMRGASAGDSARSEAVVVQNFRKLRREMPRASSRSLKGCCLRIMMPPQGR